MELRQQQEQLEAVTLSPHACRSAQTRGRARPETECGIRTCFQRDTDRIVYSKAFRRLKHKTQVFLQPLGDHYRTRMTHTIEVSRIARTIARGLRLNEDLAEAAAYGHETGRLETLSCELGGFDLIVNTIPAQVLDRRRLQWVNPGAFLLDLASAPGGVDRAAAKELGLRVLQAPGLPGRTAPVTAAAAIRDSVYHILWELEA